MTVSDALAGYGAVVATVVAIMQIGSYFEQKIFLKARIYAEIDLPSKHLEISLTNLSDHNLSFDFIGLGYFYRPWFAPWLRRNYEALGINIYKDADSIDDGIIYKIPAHEVCFACHVSKGEPWSRRRRWFGLEGFDYRLGLLVEHSLSSKPTTILLG